MTDRAQEIAAAVAPLLIGAWRFNRRATEAHVWQHVVLSDDAAPGRGIEFKSYMQGGARFEVSGQLPSQGGSWWRSPSITVSQDRTPRAIAGDINRRLLPGYLALWEKRRADIERHLSEDAEHLQRYELLRKAAPDLTTFYHNHPVLSSDSFRFSKGKVRMHRRYDRLTLELSLSFAQVLQILFFLQGLEDDQ